jgi:hypothetical protein
VTRARVDGRVAQIDKAGGPPPEVPIEGLQMVFDAGQGPAVVLQLFDTAQDMPTGAERSRRWMLGKPGTRVSVARARSSFTARASLHHDRRTERSVSLPISKAGAGVVATEAADTHCAQHDPQAGRSFAHRSVFPWPLPRSRPMLIGFNNSRVGKPTR